MSIPWVKRFKLKKKVYTISQEIQTTGIHRLQKYRNINYRNTEEEKNKSKSVLKPSYGNTEIQMVPTGPRYPKGTLNSKVSKRYQKVQGIQRVPKGPR